MKCVIAFILLLPLWASACPLYFKMGAGYKISEPDYIQVSNGAHDDMVKFTGRGENPSARFELACETKHFNFGISHHSHWLDGLPVNRDEEYWKTEIFIDLKIRLSK